jgi:predicted metal-binding membrane protein
MGGSARSALSRVGIDALVPLGIGIAWVISIATQLTGSAALLHHHALIEGGPPLWVAVPLFLLGWQVMLAAMMLPASLPTLRVVATDDARAASWNSQASFLAAFAAVWTAFGLFAFAGDFVLHHMVDATPWLAARPWLIEGGVLGLAGAYQLSPLKRRSLDACRDPMELMTAASGVRHGGPFEMGLIHGLVCLGSSWALMLLMFAEGFANLGWMAALTLVMVYEASGRRGQLAATLTGLALLGLSAATFAAA